MINEYKIEVVKTNIDARKREIADYEINIFNYGFMAERIEDEAERAGILRGVEENKTQMLKIQMVLDALDAQLEALTN